MFLLSFEQRRVFLPFLLLTLTVLEEICRDAPPLLV